MNARQNDWHKWIGKTREAERMTRQRERRELIRRMGYAEGKRAYRLLHNLPEIAERGMTRPTDVPANSATRKMTDYAA